MTSGQINCPAPLLEGPADARLAKLLVLAPYVVTENKAAKKAMGTQKSARRPGVSDSSSDESKTHSSREDEEEEEETSPPPAGGGKKRKAAPTGEAEGSKKGKPFLRTTPPTPRRRRGVAAQGQAPSKIVSIRTPEQFIVFLSCTAPPYAEYDYAARPVVERLLGFVGREFTSARYLPPPYG